MQSNLHTLTSIHEVPVTLNWNILERKTTAQGNGMAVVHAHIGQVAVHQVQPPLLASNPKNAQMSDLKIKV